RGTGTIVGRAVLPNPDLSLIPGLFARLRLPGSGEYRAILVPDEAISSDQSEKFVYVVDGEGKTEYRQVKLGPLVDGLRVVREGLTPAEWIVVAGLQRIRPGGRCDARREAAHQPATVAAADPTTSTTEPAPDRRR